MGCSLYEMLTGRLPFEDSTAGRSRPTCRRSILAAARTGCDPRTRPGRPAGETGTFPRAGSTPRSAGSPVLDSYASGGSAPPRNRRHGAHAARRADDDELGPARRYLCVSGRRSIPAGGVARRSHTSVYARSSRLAAGAPRRPEFAQLSSRGSFVSGPPGRRGPSRRVGRGPARRGRRPPGSLGGCGGLPDDGAARDAASSLPFSRESAHSPCRRSTRLSPPSPKMRTGTVSRVRTRMRMGRPGPGGWCSPLASKRD